MLKEITLIVVFLLFCQALYAQEAEYSFDYIDGKPEFYQRLTWERDEYALNYEVLIEVFDNGYREYSRDTAKDNFIQVQLLHGKYRYCVTPYDLLGNRGESSEWKEFEVLPAYQPALNSFTPDVFYLDRNVERVITISGANFLEESEIYLQGITGTLYPDNVTIINNGSATLHFDDMKLVPGSYDIYIKNPGGLSVNSGKFVIGYRKPLDFFLKLLWTPVIPVSGYMKDIMGPNVNLAGLSFCFEAISSRRGNFNGGLELTASVIYFNPGVFLQAGNENNPMGFLDTGTEFLLTSFDLNIALQRRFNRGRMSVTFRFGIGIATVVDYTNNNNEQNDIVIQLNVGADYLVRLYRDLYLEAGLDFNNHVSSVSSGSSDSTGLIRPRLGVVWQF